jgi:hypothetical protein
VLSEPIMKLTYLKDKAKLPPCAYMRTMQKSHMENLRLSPGCSCGAHRIGGCMGLRISLTDVKRKIPNTCWGLIPGSSPAGHWDSAPGEESAGS